jgi:hypothetical protein
MTAKRKILKPVGKPSFSVKEAIKIIRELKKERLAREERRPNERSK